MRLLNGALGRFLGGGDDEIAHTSALHFSGAFYDYQRIRCDPRLNPRCAIRFPRHYNILLHQFIKRNCTAKPRTKSRSEWVGHSSFVLSARILGEASTKRRYLRHPSAASLFSRDDFRRTIDDEDVSIEHHHGIRGKIEISVNNARFIKTRCQPLPRNEANATLGKQGGLFARETGPKGFHQTKPQQVLSRLVPKKTA